jgi:DNA-binding transcriptional MerR regulator
MGNGNSKGLSVNAKTIILLILFLDVGFTVKMIHKYNEMKDAGFVREKTFAENMEKRIMKAFGSPEEALQLVEEAVSEKVEVEKLAATLRTEHASMKSKNRQLTEANSQLITEVSRLQEKVKELKK